jgi:hypothetical protein
MRRRANGDRSYRRALVIGIGLSVAVHAVVLAYGRLGVKGMGEERSALRLLTLADDETPRDAPLEVIEIREATATEAGGSPATARLATIPAVPQLAAALSAGVPQPAMFLEELEEREDPENPAVSYASVSDYLLTMSPNPKALRPIDDRPVEVLARIGGSGRGVGVGVGGGHCPPGGLPGLRRSAVNRTVVRARGL